MEQVSKRALSARRNGRIGGLKTAQTHSVDFLEQRASKAGTSTCNRYGIGYYVYLASKAKKVLKVVRKSSKKYNQEVIQSITSSSTPKDNNSVELMKAATATLEV